MNKKIRYSGIAAITFSLFMLSLGSMPTIEAGGGPVTSNLAVTITCGATVSNGAINWDGPITPGNQFDSETADHTGATPNVLNPGANTATSNVGAQAGDSNTGGYVGTVSAVTHLPPSEMDVDLVGEATVALPNPLSDVNAIVSIGKLAAGANANLQLQIDATVATLLNKPITDLTWAATITITAACEIV